MDKRPELEPPEQTTDLPAAGPSTARRADTSYRVDVPLLDETGAFPAGDASSLTGGYTPSDMPERIPGTPIVPGFEILDELGRGGMGVVYKARQVALDRIVALKMILAGPHAREKDLKRFEAEARAVGKFQHPNIVQIHEVGDAGGLPYFSLEFVPEGSLSQKINRDPQAPRYAAEIVEALARAMHYAHERGIIHRDLKPANVLLAADGTPKITDFGLAKQLESDSGQTQAGQVLGTPSYMAPEQAYGDSDKITPAADIYALGGILYDLLTGRPPFSGTSVIETLEMVRTREPVPPTQLVGKLPRDLETIALKCLQKDPARRYATAGDLAEDLRRFLTRRPILARPVSAIEKTWRWAKRNPWVAGLGSGVAVLLIAVALITSLLSYRLSIKKDEADTAKDTAEKALVQEEIAKNKAQDEQHKAEIARDDEKKARTKTAEQRRLALDTVRGVLRNVDDLMKNDRRFARLRRRIVDTMLVDLDKVRDHALKNPLEDRTEAIAFSRIADIYKSSGRIQDAAVWLNKAYPILKSVADDNPNDPAALFNLAAIKNQLADAEWRLGSSEKGHRLYEEALKIRQDRVPLIEALIKQGKLAESDLANARQLVAESFGLLAFSHLRLGNLKAAAENYLDSDRGYAALPKAWSGALPQRRARAEIQVRLGDCRLREGDFKQAEKHYRAALTERETLVKLTPEPKLANELVKSDVAQSRMYLGDFFLMAQKNAAAASREYAEALAIYSGQLADEKDNLELQRLLSSVHYRLGYVASKETALAALVGTAWTASESRRQFTECLKLRSELASLDAKDTQGQIELMLVRARLGESAVVEKMAAALLAKAGEERPMLFQVACGLSIAGTGTGDAAKRCREQAFKVIANLIERGWKDRGSLEFDPDLEGVRGDKRFDELLARLKR
jgi:eukaryotic-like serine/threonine-protein kinase